MNDKPEREDVEALLARLPADDPRRRLLEVLIPDETFTHEEAQALLPDYVTDELLGRPVRELHPRLHRHLFHCQQCAVMYAAMIADVTEEFPQPVTIPEPDLSFLFSPPDSRLNEILNDVRSATKEALQSIVASAWPQLQDELKMVTRVFFRQVDQFGDNFILQPNAARAMGFGSGEVPLSQIIAAATYRSNMALMGKYKADETPARAALAQEAKTIAENAARSMGLSGAEKDQFVASYLAWLTEKEST